VAQVGEAVAHMDQVTQQNAALVEQMAAAASSLQQQANELVQTMSVLSVGSPSQPEANQAVGCRRAGQTLLAAWRRPRATPASVPAPAPFAV
jgi:hypothetical protein